MVDGLNAMLSLPESALKLREMRQELLASNIANADTPNYKARDIDFSAALKQMNQRKLGQVQGNQPALGLATTAAAHQPGVAGNNSGIDVLYRNDRQGSIDGNDVDTDHERNQFADNGLRYEATVTLITSQIHAMLAVLQG